MRIQTKLTILLLLVSFGVLLGAGTFFSISVEDYFLSRLHTELTRQAIQFEYVIRTFPDSAESRYVHLQRLAQAANLRLTLIGENGVVQFESERASEQLSRIENHLYRFEVQEALRAGVGSDVRKSATINIEMLYLAKKIYIPFPLETGFANVKILRVGIPLTHVKESTRALQSQIILVSILVLFGISIITILISRKFAKPIIEMARIAEQIRAGDFKKRIPVRSNDELGKLAENLNSMVDKLNEDINELTKLERVRTEFLGNVSHELRTPIFAMQGFLETLLHGAIDDKEVGRDYVERALKNTERLNALLGDLIEISRIESGEMKMSFDYFPVETFFAHLIADMKPLADPKNIGLSYNMSSSGLTAYGDENRLKQVMINLIENAIKYTPQGGSVFFTASSAGDTITLRVNDTGIGIAEEHLTRIFERFYRVDRERSRDSGGTGLGLAIVKHIIEAHGSKVKVKSRVGIGSEFSFTLKSA